ncbi:TPA: hypothetical protein ACGTGW_004785, partial [Salmonella enterica]
TAAFCVLVSSIRFTVPCICAFAAESLATCLPTLVYVAFPEFLGANYNVHDDHQRRYLNHAMVV